VVRGEYHGSHNWDRTGGALWALRVRRTRTDRTTKVGAAEAVQKSALGFDRERRCYPIHRVGESLIAHWQRVNLGSLTRRSPRFPGTRVRSRS
jgi:hypothetical protein